MQQITAMGGGGFLMEGTPLLDDFILSRARASRVCFVATASGDHDRMLVNFYTALGPRCRATHLPLFRRQHADVVAHLLAQDVIDGGGGTPPNMLAVGRIHGVDLALRRAYEAGILLCGVSAGALCWFDSGVTDAFGGPLRRLDDALGLLPGSVCPHDDGDPRRRPPSSWWPTACRPASPPTPVPRSIASTARWLRSSRPARTCARTELSAAAAAMCARSRCPCITLALLRRDDRERAAGEDDRQRLP